MFARVGGGRSAGFNAQRMPFHHGARVQLGLRTANELKMIAPERIKPESAPRTGSRLPRSIAVFVEDKGLRGVAEIPNRPDLPSAYRVAICERGSSHRAILGLRANLCAQERCRLLRLYQVTGKRGWAARALSGSRGRFLLARSRVREL